MPKPMPDLLLIPLSSRTNKRGLAPLVLRITYDGRRADYRTGIRLEPGQWNQARQKVRGDSKEADELTQDLKAILRKARKSAKRIKKAHRKALKSNNPKALKDCPPLSARAVADALRARHQAQLPDEPTSLPQSDPDTYTLLESTRHAHYATGNEHTFHAHRAALHKWLLWRNNEPLPVSQLSRTLVRNFAAWMAQRYAPTSISTWLNNLHALYEHALPDSANPFRKASPRGNKQTKPRYRLTAAELQAFRALELTTPLRRLARAVYLTQYYLHGSRVGAVLLLTWEQVDLVAGRVRFKMEKRGGWKHIRLHPQLRALLEGLGPKPSGYVFGLLPAEYASLDKADRRRRKMNAVGSLNSCLYTVGQKLLKLPGRLHTHTARHTFAAHSYAAGVPMEQIRDMLGHRDIEQTKAYIGSLNTSELDDAADTVYGLLDE
jgi:integrase/recombinase XerD